MALVVAGDYALGHADAPARLVDAWVDLAQSSTGRLLGIDQPGAAPVVSVRPDQLRLTVDLDLVPVVAGLHAVLDANVAEIMGGEPRRAPARDTETSPASGEK
jgi:hypothetical protein